MGTKHSFIILNLIPYVTFFEGIAAKIISYQQNEQFVFIDISMVTGVRGK